MPLIRGRRRFASRAEPSAGQQRSGSFGSRFDFSPGCSLSPRSSVLLLVLARHLLELVLAHPRLCLLALALALQLGAHELSLLLGLGRHRMPPFGAPSSWRGREHRSVTG